MNDKEVIIDFIHFPLWDDIVEQCKFKIEKNYPKYGNEWITTIDNVYWNDRIQQELDETKNAKSKSERQKELIDVINVAAMALETCEETNENQR